MPSARINAPWQSWPHDASGHPMHSPPFDASLQYSFRFMVCLSHVVPSRARLLTPKTSQSHACFQRSHRFFYGITKPSLLWTDKTSENHWFPRAHRTHRDGVMLHNDASRNDERVGRTRRLSWLLSCLTPVPRARGTHVPPVMNAVMNKRFPTRASCTLCCIRFRAFLSVFP